MNCHGRKLFCRMFAVAALLVAATGCHSLQPGAPHPFTTIVQPENFAYRVDSPKLNDSELKVASTQFTECKVASAQISDCSTQRQ